MTKEINEFKAQARRLHKHLQSMGAPLSYSQSLEALAALHGVANWRTLQGTALKKSVTPPMATAVRSIFECHFMEGPAGEPVITQLLLQDEAGADNEFWYRTLRHVSEEVLDLLAKEAALATTGEPADDELLEELKDAKDCLVLDWGDEFEGEGLTTAELRGIRQVSPSRFQLKDGRMLEFIYAQALTVAPVPEAHTAKAPEPQSMFNPDLEHRYVHGNWGHLFGPGMSEVTVRFVYDRVAERIVAMHIEAPLHGWEVCSPTQIADVEDSLKHANEDALENPADWGLDESDELPDWAM